MTHPLFDLTGRVAIVSGAASGMGRITSIAFAEVGADVVLLDINEVGAQETAHEIEQMGQRALPINCDISNADQIRAAYERVDNEWGRVDVLSNIAGEGIRNDPLELTEDEIQQVMQNLVVGRYICTQEAAKRMMAQGRGSIFSIVSIAGLSALGRNHIAYSMAMGAVCGDDTGTEHRVEQPGRARQRHCMRPDYERGLAGKDRGGPRSWGFLLARIADRPYG